MFQVRDNIIRDQQTAYNRFTTATQIYIYKEI